MGATVPSTGAARRASNDLALALSALLAAAVGFQAAIDLPFDYLMVALTLYALQGAVVVWAVPAKLPTPGIGVANRVTLARSTLVMPVAALTPYSTVLGERAYWCIVLAGAVALALDGVDGWLARRTGTCTDFGGRYDMELDAFFMLALSVLVWRSNKVGAWVLLIGVLRYLFVAAGRVWPALRRELQPSLRRKAICVVQGLALLACLAPGVAPALASAGATGALVLLTYSFAVDVRRLVADSSRQAEV